MESRFWIVMPQWAAILDPLPGQDMKALVAALALATAVPATAHAAAAPDPVAAVRALLARNAGVTLEFLGSTGTDLFWQNDATREQISGGVGLKGTGKLQLGATGVTASEITRVVQLSGQVLMKQEAAKGDAYFAGLLKSAGTTRMISTKGWLYHLLPKARTWLRTGRAGGGAAAYGDQIINVLEPATLAKLLSTADRSSVTPWHKNRTTGRNQRIYTRSGTITLKELYRVSPTFREAAGTSAVGTDEIWWQYLYDDRGLPDRLGWHFQTTTKADSIGLGDNRIRSVRLVTRFWNWQAKVSITAPKATPGRGPAVDEITDILRAGDRPR
ncbi:hypothetical protein [Nonomuraea bangladeshensis]|uniref:hypothetical protein n=1 Tax=Nonomuraea bangladeshensis TaxID=404385 RepID=UPI003C2B002E